MRGKHGIFHPLTTTRTVLDDEVCESIEDSVDPSEIGSVVIERPVAGAC